MMDTDEGNVLSVQEFHAVCHLFDVRSRHLIREGSLFEAVDQFYSVSDPGEEEPFAYLWLAPTAEWVWFGPEAVDDEVIELFD